MFNVCRLLTLILQNAVIGVKCGIRFQKAHAKSELLRSPGSSFHDGGSCRHKILADSIALLLLMKNTTPVSGFTPMSEKAPVTYTEMLVT
jgi:hypothetical protein